MRRQGWWFLPAMLGVGLAVWATGLDGPFIYDDVLHIETNERIRNLADLSAVFHSGYQETRPLYMLTVALCYRFAGNAPALYHLVNIALHLANAVLFWALVRRWIARDDGAARAPSGTAEVSALVFLVHPMCTESVSYINSRSGLLAAFFGLLTMHAYLQCREAVRRRWLWHAASIAACCLGFLSKESAIVFPALLAVRARHRGSLARSQ